MINDPRDHSTIRIMTTVYNLHFCFPWEDIIINISGGYNDYLMYGHTAQRGYQTNTFVCNLTHGTPFILYNINESKRENM